MTDSPVDTAENQTRKGAAYTALYAEAAQIARRCLWGRAGREARHYLMNTRKVDWLTAVDAGVGYLPERDVWVPAFRKHGVSDEMLVEASLARRGADGQLHDRPRGGGYLTLPMTAADGHMTGLKMRAVPGVVGPGALRYVATSTALADAMFGFHRVPPDVRHVIAVEGEIDQLSIETVRARRLTRDIPPAIAMGGNQVTSARLAVLRQRIDRVTLLYDGNAGGREGIRAGSVALMNAGIAVDIIPMPTDQDANTVLAKERPEALVSLLRTTPVTLIEAEAIFAHAAQDDERDALFVANTLRATAALMGNRLTPQAAQAACDLVGLPTIVLDPNLRADESPVRGRRVTPVVRPDAVSLTASSSPRTAGLTP